MEMSGHFNHPAICGSSAFFIADVIVGPIPQGVSDVAVGQHQLASRMHIVREEAVKFLLPDDPFTIAFECLFTLSKVRLYRAKTCLRNGNIGECFSLVGPYGSQLLQ